MHLRFSREVAVKVMLAPNGKGNSRERFVREGRTAAKVSHEHVVQVMDAGESEGVAYLVMELVTGYSLGKILDEKGSLTPEVVALLGAQIALGLAAIHAKGVIHRDIKPDNILISQEKKAKITDLGLAKQTDDPEINRLTATGMVVGTPLYVSPESIRDPRTAGAPSDIYSMGATLYHMLVGKPPFPEGSPYEVMRAHLETRVRPLRELKPEVPTGLAQLVERCLHKSPERRPTALELADLLSHGAELKASASRGLALVLAIAAVVVLGGAAGGWVVLKNLRAAAPAEIPTTASVIIQVNEPAARARLDGGPWAAVGAPLATSPGKHHLTVESTRIGALRRYEDDLDLAANQRREVAVTLATVGVPELRIPVPGEGMVFCNGTAFGVEAAYPVSQAGSYALARWDGSTWKSFTASIDPRGQLSNGPLTTLDHPEGPAYWRDGDNDGQPLPPHHVVCWWEVEQARERAKLPPPPGWLLQGERREQPALGLTPALIEALCGWLGPRLAMVPETEAAGRFSAVYRSGLWTSNHNRLQPLGGPLVNALLVVVPTGK